MQWCVCVCVLGSVCARWLIHNHCSPRAMFNTFYMQHVNNMYVHHIVLYMLDRATTTITEAATSVITCCWTYELNKHIRIRRISDIYSYAWSLTWVTQPGIRGHIYILRRSALRWCMRDGGVDGIIEEWTGNMLGSRERCVLFGRWSNRKRKESLGRRERCEAQNTFGSIHGFWIHVVSHKRVLDTWLCRRRVCPFFLYYILHLLRSRALVWWVRDAVSWWNLGESRGPSEWILCICLAVGDDDNAETRQLRNDE